MPPPTPECRSGALLLHRRARFDVCFETGSRAWLRITDERSETDCAKHSPKGERGESISWFKDRHPAVGRFGILLVRRDGSAPFASSVSVRRSAIDLD